MPQLQKSVSPGQFKSGDYKQRILGKIFKDVEVQEVLDEDLIQLKKNSFQTNLM